MHLWNKSLDGSSNDSEAGLTALDKGIVSVDPHEEDIACSPKRFLKRKEIPSSQKSQPKKKTAQKKLADKVLSQTN